MSHLFEYQLEESDMDDEEFYERYCLDESESSMMPSVMSYQFSELTNPRSANFTRSYILNQHNGCSGEIDKNEKRSKESLDCSEVEYSIDFNDKSQVYEYLVLEEKESKLLYSNDKVGSDFNYQSTKSSRY